MLASMRFVGVVGQTGNSCLDQRQGGVIRTFNNHHFKIVVAGVLKLWRDAHKVADTERLGINGRDGRVHRV
jgi:hypothetical protein